MKIMKLLIVQVFFISILLFTFFACKDSKTPEVKKEAKITEPAIGSETNTSGETTTTTPNPTATIKNYEIPQWPEKLKEGKGKLYPFDEAPKDANFLKFRQQLYNIVRAKNVNRFLAFVPEKLHFSFGEDTKKESFIKYWKLDTAPNDSDMWKEFAMCLELGGSFSSYQNKKRYGAPYVYMLEVFEDVFFEGVVIGDNVRLREKPSSDAKIVGSLSWDHVKIENEDNATKETINGEENYWLKLKTLKGEKGYAYGKYVRTPIDYRIGFIEEEPGKWMIEFFIAGD